MRVSVASQEIVSEWDAVSFFIRRDMLSHRRSNRDVQVILPSKPICHLDLRSGLLVVDHCEPCCPQYAPTAARSTSRNWRKERQPRISRAWLLGDDSVVSRIFLHLSRTRVRSLPPSPSHTSVSPWRGQLLPHSRSSAPSPPLPSTVG